MSCLTYLLDLWRRGHRFKIYYDGHHCIGVNETKLFDFGNFLKQDFLNENKINFIPIEKCHTKEIIIKIFELNETDTNTLYEYFEQI